MEAKVNSLAGRGGSWQRREGRESNMMVAFLRDL